MDVLLCTVVKTSLFFSIQEVGELQQQLQSNEREKEILRLQLTRKEAELTRAEETIRREQQQVQQQVSDCVVTCKVEPPITDPPTSGEPLYNGHWLCYILSRYIRSINDLLA